MRVCYASLPVSHATRDTIRMVGRAGMVVDYYEPDNVPGRTYCAEHHLLELVRQAMHGTPEVPR